MFSLPPSAARASTRGWRSAQRPRRAPSSRVRPAPQRAGRRAPMARVFHRRCSMAVRWRVPAGRRGRRRTVPAWSLLCARASGEPSRSAALAAGTPSASVWPMAAFRERRQSGSAVTMAVSTTAHTSDSVSTFLPCAASARFSSSSATFSAPVSRSRRPRDARLIQVFRLAWKKPVVAITNGRKSVSRHQKGTCVSTSAVPTPSAMTNETTPKRMRSARCFGPMFSRQTSAVSDTRLS